MQEKIEGRHKKITHIQNTIWDIYKSFLNNQDLEEYNLKWTGLLETYRYPEEEELFSFCKCQFISWEQVIRGFAKEFRDNGKK